MTKLRSRWTLFLLLRCTYLATSSAVLNKPFIISPVCSSCYSTLEFDFNRISMAKKLFHSFLNRLFILQLSIDETKIFHRDYWWLKIHSQLLYLVHQFPRVTTNIKRRQNITNKFNFQYSHYLPFSVLVYDFVNKHKIVFIIRTNIKHLFKNNQEKTLLANLFLILLRR